MIKALLIGCGNIGAGYDLNEDTKVWTHAKSFALTKDIELSLFDENIVKSRQIADRYRVKVLENLQEAHYSQYDIISITTPTTTHFDYLSKILSYHVPVVICEKPVVSSIEQAERLEELYRVGRSKVIVNYIRRFQPGYQLAKRKLLNLKEQQSLRGIIVKYKRGFLNNASHAIDLLEFIFEKPFEFKTFYFNSIKFDAFEYDPTLVGSCNYQEVPVSFMGIADSSYSIFEIELFYENSKVVICHAGNEIRYYYEKAGSLVEDINERQTNLLDVYMLPVINHAVTLLNNLESEDNFMPSLRLNKEVLRIIEPLIHT